MKKEKKDLLNEEIHHRINYEKDLKPKKVEPEKKKPTQMIMGTLLFIIVAANLIYMLSSFFR